MYRKAVVTMRKSPTAGKSLKVQRLTTIREEMGNPFTGESGDTHLKDISDHSVNYNVSGERKSTVQKNIYYLYECVEMYNTDVSRS